MALFFSHFILRQETKTQSIRAGERAWFEISSWRPMLPGHYGYVARLEDIQFVRCRVEPRGEREWHHACSARRRFPICAIAFRVLIDTVSMFETDLLSSCSWHFKIAGLAGSRGETMVRTGIVVPSEQHDVVAPLLLV